MVPDRYMSVDAPRVWLPRSGASRDERFQGVELADQGLSFPVDLRVLPAGLGSFESCGSYPRSFLAGSLVRFQCCSSTDSCRTGRAAGRLDWFFDECTGETQGRDGSVCCAKVDRRLADRFWFSAALELLAGAQKVGSMQLRII